jgi:alpha-tubulin suppressor-like RCC1 family protein
VFAIKTDGTLWGWGANLHGVLGDGTSNSSYSPVKIMDDVAVVSIGEDHTAAIKTDGSLWTWGFGSLGRLGNSGWEEKSTPQKIADGGFKDVSAGKEHSVAVMTDGSIWAWGFNGNGECGIGATVNSDVFEAVRWDE